MALMVCRDCSTAFAVGLFRCPQCTGTDCVEDSQMPKITVHGGPTNADAEPGQPGYVHPATEEEPSPGISSPTSQPKPPPTAKRSTGARPKRARTTGNRSNKESTGSSTAGSTDGSTPATG